MTPLAGNVSRPWREGGIVVLPVQAGAHVRQGSYVEADGAGRVAPAAKGTSGERYVGVALGEADNAGGAAGALSVEIRRKGAFRFATTGTAVPGKLAQLEDDDTVTDDATGRQPCGLIIAADGGSHVWVDIERRTA